MWLPNLFLHLIWSLANKRMCTRIYWSIIWLNILLFNIYFIRFLSICVYIRNEAQRQRLRQIPRDRGEERRKKEASSITAGRMALKIILYLAVHRAPLSLSVFLCTSFSWSSRFFLNRCHLATLLTDRLTIFVRHFSKYTEFFFFFINNIMYYLCVLNCVRVYERMMGDG